MNKLLETQLAVVVSVDGLEGVGGQIGVESEDLEEERKFVALDHSVAVGVDRVEENRKRSAQGLSDVLVLVQLALDGLNEQRLGQRFTPGNAFQIFVPNLQKLALKFLAPLGVQLLALDEPLGHRLEILLRDRPVLVEVDACEVGSHFPQPKVRHFRGLSFNWTDWTTGILCPLRIVTQRRLNRCEANPLDLVDRLSG
jgi:hypothetical protein